MSKTYRPYLPEQELLLPPSLRHWLPENHLAFFVSDVVDQLDLSAIERHYEAETRGQPPYHPRLMVKLLVYGYCLGVRSSRKIAQRIDEDIAFRVLAAANRPDFRTLSDFRKIHLTALEGLFAQVLRLALEAGAVKLGRVSLDSTKMKANASKHKAMSWKRMQETEQRLQREVSEILAAVERNDQEEDARWGERRGDELPAELARRQSRLERIREVPPFDILHDVEGCLVLEGADTIHGRDVGVANLRRGSRLPIESFPRGLVLGQLRLHELDGDHTLKRPFPSQIDLRHGGSAQ